MHHCVLHNQRAVHLFACAIAGLATAHACWHQLKPCQHFSGRRVLRCNGSTEAGARARGASGLRVSRFWGEQNPLLSHGLPTPQCAACLPSGVMSPRVARRRGVTLPG